MKRDTRTPKFWTSEPVGQLPKGQGAFAFAEAPEPCGDRYGGFLPPCILPAGHAGRHTAGVALGDGLTDSWGTLRPDGHR